MTEYFNYVSLFFMRVCPQQCFVLFCFQTCFNSAFLPANIPEARLQQLLEQMQFSGILVVRRDS